MNNTVEETRRGLFEQHISIPESVAWSYETNSYIGQNFWLVDYAWEAFNAALDAVEIELPSKYKTEEGYSMYDVDEIIACIQNINLGLKIK